MISQTLLKTKDGQGRVAAHEIMIGTPAIRNLIRENKVAQMYSAIQTAPGGRHADARPVPGRDWCAATMVNVAEARNRAVNKDLFMRLSRAELAARAHRGPRMRRPSMERERATKFIHELLDLLVKQKGSDLFITAGFPPAIKVDGKITPVSKTALTPQHTIELVRSVMNDKQAAEFEVDEGVQLRDQPAGHRPLPRQRLRPAGPRRHGAAHDHHRHPEVRGAGPAAGAEGRHHVASAAS